MTTVRVLLADDEHLIRGALAALLALEDDLVVVAEAATGPEALAMARAHRPDVAVLDLEMPGADGVSVATSLRSELPGCRTMIVTSHGRPGHLKRALAAGVRAFVPKTVSARQLAGIIRAVHMRQPLRGPGVGRRRDRGRGLSADRARGRGAGTGGGRGAGRGDRGAGLAVAGNGAELPVLRGLEARGREPSCRGASRAGAGLGIVVLALRRLRT